MSFDSDALRNQLPYYLSSDPERKELLSELEALIGGATRGYYIGAARGVDEGEILQGDVWRDFELYSFETQSKHKIKAMVLSNSCDVSRKNKREFPPRVSFAPLIKLEKIADRLSQAGISRTAVEAKIEAIRNQKVTSIFFLPKDTGLDDEYVVLLDDLHSMPLKNYKGTEKVLTLSMAGFYLFAFKLSVHFCRLHENVDRRAKLA